MRLRLGHSPALPTKPPLVKQADTARALRVLLDLGLKPTGVAFQSDGSLHVHLGDEKVASRNTSDELLGSR